MPFECGGYRLVAYGAGSEPLVVLGQWTWDDAYRMELNTLRALVQASVHDHGTARPPRS